MIKCNLKSYNDNRGSALITGLVVSTVLMVLCFSLILIAYSLFVSSTRTSYDITNREMLFSAAEGLELELTDVVMTSTKNVNGVYTISSPESNNRIFWMYIYDSIINQDYDNNTDWPYYDRSIPDSNVDDIHSKERSSRYFELTKLDDESNEKIIVQFFWEKPDEWQVGISTNKTGTKLNAIYRLYDTYTNEVLVKTERKYFLIYNGSDTIGNITNDDNTTEDNDEDSGMMDDLVLLPYNMKKIYSKNGIEIDFQYNPQQSSTQGINIKNITGSKITNWGFKIQYDGVLTTNNNYHFSCVKYQNENAYLLMPNYYENDTYGRVIDSNGETGWISLVFDNTLDAYPVFSQVLLDREDGLSDTTNGSNNTNSSTENNSSDTTVNSNENDNIWTGVPIMQINDYQDYDLENGGKIRVICSGFHYDNNGTVPVTTYKIQVLNSNNISDFKVYMKINGSIINKWNIEYDEEGDGYYLFKNIGNDNGITINGQSFLPFVSSNPIQTNDNVGDQQIYYKWNRIGEDNIHDILLGEGVDDDGI